MNGPIWKKESVFDYIKRLTGLQFIIVLVVLLVCAGCGSAETLVEKTGDNANAGAEVIRAENEAFRLSVDRVESDTHVTMIHFSVESLQGEDISSCVPEFDVQMNADGRTQYQRLESFPEETSDQKPNVLYHCIRILRFTEPTEYSLKVQSLTDYENQKNIPVDLTVAEDSIKLCDQIQLADQSAYKNMTLSQYGFWLEDESVPALELHDEMPAHDVFLLFKDGTRTGYTKDEYAKAIQAGEEISWIEVQFPNREYSCLSIIFTEPILLEDVAGIEIDGKVIR